MKITDFFRKYGQYFTPQNGPYQNEDDNPMTLTSMMLYLDRVTEVDVETAEYSETQVGKCLYN